MSGGDGLVCHVRSAMGEFDAAFDLAWRVCRVGRAATHYRIFPPDAEEADSLGWNAGRIGVFGQSLCFYWSTPEEEQGAQELPYAMDVQSAREFARGWLRTAEYGREPDHDGSNVKGFGITSGGAWGHFRGSHYSMFAVTAEWIMHGK